MTSKEEPVISIWSGLGHPAFDNEYVASLEEIEWWSKQDSESDDIISS